MGDRTPHEKGLQDVLLSPNLLIVALPGASTVERSWSHCTVLDAPKGFVAFVKTCRDEGDATGTLEIRRAGV